MAAYGDSGGVWLAVVAPTLSYDLRYTPWKWILSVITHFAAHLGMQPGWRCLQAAGAITQCLLLGRGKAGGVQGELVMATYNVHCLVSWQEGA